KSGETAAGCRSTVEGPLPRPQQSHRATTIARHRDAGISPGCKWNETADLPLLQAQYRHKNRDSRPLKIHGDPAMKPLLPLLAALSASVSLPVLAQDA